MSNPVNTGRIKRPTFLLNEFSREYPGIFDHIDTFRQGRGDDLPDWPEWCFLPYAAWHAIMSNQMQMDRLPPMLLLEVSRLAALGTWRYTQSIYRIDNDMRQAIESTIPSGALPCDVLYRMPEWCVWIETDRQWFDQKLNGFFAMLEYDVNRNAPELRLLLDPEAGNPIIQILHLGNWTITEAVDRAVDESRKQAQIAKIDAEIPADLTQHLSEQLYPLISLVLYICSNGVEYRAQKDRPENPQAKKTRRHGWRLFPAAHTRVWNLGDKTGEAIRQARAQDKTDRKGPAPHVRRAHWHGFWSGPRDGDRKFNLRWLPPNAIAGDNNVD